MDKNPINKRFRAAFCYLLEKDWKRKQKALAAELGVSDATISEIKSGNNEASPELQTRIVRAMKYSFDDFLELGRSILGNQSPEVIEQNQPPNRNNIYQFNRRKTDPPPDERLQVMIDNLQKIYKSGNEQMISGIELSLKAFAKAEKTRKVKIPER